MRLHAVSPDRIIPEQLFGFEAPNNVDTWRAYLSQITNTHTPGSAFGDTLTANLAHRLQLLEFETALLLHHKESVAQHHHSALHESVLVLKIHQHIVLCHSILEGIGSHFNRFRRAQNGHPVVLDDKVPAKKCRNAILALCFPDLAQADRATLTTQFETLTDRRDRIHLDTVKPGARMHFHDFGIENAFVPTYALFRRILTAMNPRWPDETCLNEQI